MSLAILLSDRTASTDRSQPSTSQPTSSSCQLVHLAEELLSAISENDSVTINDLFRGSRWGTKRIRDDFPRLWYMPPGCSEAEQTDPDLRLDVLEAEADIDEAGGCATVYQLIEVAAQHSLICATYWSRGKGGRWTCYGYNTTMDQCLGFGL